MLHFRSTTAALPDSVEGLSDSLTPLQVTLLRLAQRNLSVWAREDIGEAHADDVELLLLLKFIEVWEPGFRITPAGVEALRRVAEASSASGTVAA